MRKINLWTGLFLSLLFAITLVTILFLVYTIVGTPFPPFDLFNFVSRSLPGDVVTFGIDNMVSAITTLNLGATDVAAKTAEQIMGATLFTVITTFSGFVYFAVVRSQLQDKDSFRSDSLFSGVALGLLFGLPLVALTLNINTSATASMGLSVIWLTLAYLGWGVAHGFAFKFLTADVVPDVSAEKLSRREFLIRVGGTSATITVLGLGASVILEQPTVTATNEVSTSESVADNLPNASASVEPAPGTRPEYTALENHYRIDINSGLGPAVDESEWELQIDGMVNNPTDLTLEQIRNDFDPMEQFITQECISNRIGGDLISTILWTGTSMQNILDAVQPTNNATHIHITSVDGFDEYVALDLIQEDETIMLAYAWDRQPLPREHGFPLRIHISDRYGMKQPKWIEHMEFVAQADEGYWVRRGWDKKAIIKTESVIDNVATNMMIDEGNEMFIPVGGIAFAGVRGISKVEVRVDGDEWQLAQLRQPLSDKTWVIWRYNWQFKEGDHTFEVRCYEGDGTMQITEDSSVRPDGATGIDSMDVML